jgi:lipopolysaccharide export system permease protein
MILWRKHDGYVARAFWSAFGAVLLYFTLIIVVIDLAERLRDLNKNWERVAETGEAPVWAMVRFYATLIPFVWLRILPIAVPMAGAFALARLARHQELVSLVAAGVPMRRVLRPILLSGALLVGLMLLARATVVPALSQENQALGRLLSKNEPDRIVQVPHMHDPGLPGDDAGPVRLSAAAFLPIKQRIEDAWLTRRAPGGGLLEAQRYPELAWRESPPAWVAPHGGVRIPLEGKDAGRYRYPIEPGAIAPLSSRVELIAILCESDNSLGFSFEQSGALMRAHPESPGLAVRHHEQWTLPLSTLILLGLTLPLCVRLGRGSVLPGLSYALGMAALYVGVSRLLGDMAGTGAVHPMVLAWMPIVLFGSLAVALHAGVRS